MDATTVGVDLAKTVFELAIANAQWRIIARQRLNRAQFTRFLTQTTPTHVVMELVVWRTTGVGSRRNTATA